MRSIVISVSVFCSPWGFTYVKVIQCGCQFTCSAVHVGRVSGFALGHIADGVHCFANLLQHKVTIHFGQIQLRMPNIHFRCGQQHRGMFLQNSPCGRQIVAQLWILQFLLSFGRLFDQFVGIATEFLVNTSRSLVKRNYHLQLSTGLGIIPACYSEVHLGSMRCATCSNHLRPLATISTANAHRPYRPESTSEWPLTTDCARLGPYCPASTSCMDLRQTLGQHDAYFCRWFRPPRRQPASLVLYRDSRWRFACPVRWNCLWPSPRPTPVHWHASICLWKWVDTINLLPSTYMSRACKACVRTTYLLVFSFGWFPHESINGNARCTVHTNKNNISFSSESREIHTHTRTHIQTQHHSFISVNPYTQMPHTERWLIDTQFAVTYTLRAMPFKRKNISIRIRMPNRIEIIFHFSWNREFRCVVRTFLFLAGAFRIHKCGNLKHKWLKCFLHRHRTNFEVFRIPFQCDRTEVTNGSHFLDFNSIYFASQMHLVNIVNFNHKSIDGRRNTDQTLSDIYEISLAGL